MIRLISAGWVAAMLGLKIASAAAGPCAQQISDFEQVVRQAGKNPDAGPTARETVAAQLSHQPTPRSVQEAEQQAQETFQHALARAKALDAKDDPSCVQALAKAKELFEVH
jgi:hypothetical protein